MRFVADFETTTDPNDCRVWAWGLVEIGNNDNFKYGNDINTFMEICKNPKITKVYFHNLKFDGTFILCWLFKNGYKWVKTKAEIEEKTFTTLISDKGLFYSINVYYSFNKGKAVKVIFQDSLKLLPFKVSQIAKDFNLPIEKGEIDYNKFRPKNHIITDEELAYLKNDVLIVSKALEVLFEQDMKKMTVGSNALAKYKETIGTNIFKKWFPVPDYDKDIRRAYKGGFTYLKPEYKCKDIDSGIVLDVNSLYPHVMRNKLLPYGHGQFFKGKYEYDKDYPLHVQQLSCSFEIKDKHIPTVAIKELTFVPNEYLTSTNDNEIVLYLTTPDIELLFKHYNVYNLEYISGWKFRGATGLFVKYIDYWSEVKINAKKDHNKAMYTLAKLMLNSLYGKFATNPKVRSKIPYSDNGIIKYKYGEYEEREPVYIPVGAFITAWARYVTINAAQKLYDRFIYADTDSLHLLGDNLPIELEISDTILGAWKHEYTFNKARFIRAKSYIEYINNNLKVVCAGMPDTCHNYVEWENFNVGASYPGKLQQTNVRNGVILKNVDFTIKP